MSNPKGLKKIEVFSDDSKNFRCETLYIADVINNTSFAVLDQKPISRSLDLQYLGTFLRFPGCEQLLRYCHSCQQRKGIRIFSYYAT